MKSLLAISEQFRRIRDGWDRSKHGVESWRRVRKIYSRYLYNIAKSNGLEIPADSNCMPGVAAMIAFPTDYWKRPACTINSSAEFKRERAREYAREVYAKI